MSTQAASCSQEVPCFHLLGAIVVRIFAVNATLVSDKSVRSHLVHEENVHEADNALHLAFGKVNCFLER